MQLVCTGKDSLRSERDRDKPSPRHEVREGVAGSLAVIFPETDQKL